MSDELARETRGRQVALVGVAVGAALGSAAIGGVVGGATSSAWCGRSVISDCGAIGILTGSLVLVTASVPPIVTLLGSGLRGRGDVLGAYLGMLIGLVPAGVLFVVGSLVDDGGTAFPIYVAGYSAAITGAWAGAVADTKCRIRRLVDPTLPCAFGRPSRCNPARCS